MTRRLFLLVAVAAPTLLVRDFTGKVVGITDGDTIRVMHNGVAERIRLWGIDDLAFGQTVTVRVRDIDRYKRTVTEIILPHWPEPEPGARAGRAGMVVSALRASGTDFARSGAGSAGGE